MQILEADPGTIVMERSRHEAKFTADSPTIYLLFSNKQKLSSLAFSAWDGFKPTTQKGMTSFVAYSVKRVGGYAGTSAHLDVLTAKCRQLAE